MLRRATLFKFSSAFLMPAHPLATIGDQDDKDEDEFSEEDDGHYVHENND